MNDLLNALNQFMNMIFVHIRSGVTVVIPDKGLVVGISIVLFTILIKTILLPLNIGQIRSSYKMQQIQPELKKLQDKYKSDPKKSQEEVMKFYKEKGVNPFAGCLPLLLQWPILIAMYFVFQHLPDIAGVHFLWVSDLSKPNDIILTAISGGTTFLSTYVMTPKNKDANSKSTTGTMTITMTLMMTFMSYSFGAALVIYWIIGNLYQIGQTLLVRKIDNDILERKNQKLALGNHINKG